MRNLELYEKYYMGDIGLRHGLLGYRDRDISGLLENVVYLELLTRGYQVSIGKWGDQEVDFVAERADERIYIQVALQLSTSETIEREFTVLERINDNFEKVVLSLDQFQSVNRGGIKHVNLLDFLMGHRRDEDPWFSLACVVPYAGKTLPGMVKCGRDWQWKDEP